MLFRSALETRLRCRARGDGTITTSIITAYFVNRCGGSVIPAIMVHGLGNDAVGLSGMASMEVVLTPYHQLTQAAPFAVMALGIVALSGPQLGLALDPAKHPEGRSSRPGRRRSPR